MLTFFAVLFALPFWKGIASTLLFVLTLFATHDIVPAVIVFICSYIFCFITEKGINK